MDKAGFDGDPQADLWLIGRDFGETERAQGRPFVGQAGYLLDQGLRAAGIRREHCYIDNVVRKQPYKNEWENHPPPDVAHGVMQLRQLISAHHPPLVVVFGNEAFRTVMGEHPDDKDVLPSITEARGYLWDSPLGPRVLASVHPAAISRQWLPWRPLFDVDLRKAKLELDAACPAFPEREVVVVNQSWILQELRNALDAYNRGAAMHFETPPVAVDIEGDFTIHCVGFAPTPDKAWVIPFKQGWQKAAVKELCEAPFAKALANGQYDRYCLAKNDINLVNHAFDVQLAWYALQPELAGKRDKPQGKKKGYSRHTQKSLRFLASIYTRDPWWKDYDFASEDEMYDLNGKDCCLTLDVALQQAKELQ